MVSCSDEYNDDKRCLYSIRLKTSSFSVYVFRTMLFVEDMLEVCRIF